MIFLYFSMFFLYATNLFSMQPLQMKLPHGNGLPANPNNSYVYSLSNDNRYLVVWRNDGVWATWDCWEGKSAFAEKLSCEGLSIRISSNNRFIALIDVNHVLHLFDTMNRSYYYFNGMQNNIIDCFDCFFSLCSLHLHVLNNDYQAETFSLPHSASCI